MGLKEDRNKDLMEAYDRTLKKLGAQARMMTRKSLIFLTINSPAKQYYVTVEQAAKHINNIEKRGISAGKTVLLQNQYEAIYRKYLKLSSELTGLRKTDILERVINSEAECFYLEPSSAYLLIWKLSNKK